MHPLTDDPTRRFRVGVVLQAGNRQVEVESVRHSGGRLLLGLVGVHDRDSAAELTSRLLVAEVDDAEETGEPDAWFDHQLIGLQARLQDGTVIGRIERVDHGAAQDLLVVGALDGAGRQSLVPFVAAIVPVVDVDGGFVVLTPPGGLLDDIWPADAAEADSQGTH